MAQFQSGTSAKPDRDMVRRLVRKRLRWYWIAASVGAVVAAALVSLLWTLAGVDHAQRALLALAGLQLVNASAWFLVFDWGVAKRLKKNGFRTEDGKWSDRAQMVAFYNVLRVSGLIRLAVNAALEATLLAMVLVVFLT